MPTLASRLPFIVPLAHGGRLCLDGRPLVMGILNVTPDSFAERTPRLVPANAAGVAFQMEAEGADLIDIGGESTRPGAEPVSAADEMARVLPVIRALAGKLRVPMSVDTYKAEVARAALDEGAALVNDVSGLRYDPMLADVVAERRAGLVLMHTRGRSRDMYAGAEYRDLLGEITAELGCSVAAATSAGVAVEHVIIDPGVGFAKRAADSYGVLAGLPVLAAALNRPVLVGPSRKSFMREALGDRLAADRDWGTAAAVAAAVLNGAHIVRVHAVAEMAQVVRVAEAIRQASFAGSTTNVETQNRER